MPNYALVTPTGSVDCFIAGNDAPVASPYGDWVEVPSDVSDQDHDLLVYRDGALVVDPAAALQRAQASAIAHIKAEVSAALEAGAWRIQRAEERDRLGLPGETVAEVLAEREALRRAGNRIEAEIDAMEDRAAVAAVQLTVADADRVSAQNLTPKAFMDRFTDAELAAILAAVDANPAMRAWWARFDKSQSLVLTDPLTVGGVHALEFSGLIDPGRADEILAP